MAFATFCNFRGWMSDQRINSRQRAGQRPGTEAADTRWALGRMRLPFVLAEAGVRSIGAVVRTWGNEQT